MPRKGAFGPHEQLLAASSAPDGLAAWIKRYLEMQTVRGLSALTLGTYRRDLAAFHAWCVERGLEHPREISKPIVERYQRSLFYYRKANGAPLSLQRQIVMLARVKALFRYLVRHNQILANPASDLELPRVPLRTLPDALSIAEVEAILAAFDLDDPAGVLGRAMTEVLYSTAIRRAELCQLNIFDIDVERGVLHVRRGKGGKGRMVPIGDRALAWVRRYVDTVRPNLLSDPAETALFVNERGVRVTPQGLGDRVDQAKRRAGVTKRGACHLLRHTAATLMLEHGADLRYIQEMLGHAKISTTQIYTHVSIGKLKAIHDATHPGAKLARKPQADEPGEDEA